MSRLPARGERVPPLDLRTAGGEPIALRGGRGPRVIVAIHGGGCADCLGYLRSLAPVLGSIAEWGGRVIAVAPDDSGGGGSLPDGIPLLLDAERRLTEDGPAVLVADEWGEVHLSMSGGAEHSLPGPDEILAEVRFLAIQCPECEGPEGEWRDL